MRLCCHTAFLYLLQSRIWFMQILIFFCKIFIMHKQQIAYLRSILSDSEWLILSWDFVRVIKHLFIIIMFCFDYCQMKYFLILRTLKILVQWHCGDRCTLSVHFLCTWSYFILIYPMLFLLSVEGKVQQTVFIAWNSLQSAVSCN